jgi:hypothetical protein
VGMTPVCAATTDRKEKDAISLDMIVSERVPRGTVVLGLKRVDVQMDKVRKKEGEKVDLTVSVRLVRDSSCNGVGEKESRRRTKVYLDRC